MLIRIPRTSALACRCEFIQQQLSRFLRERPGSQIPSFPYHLIRPPIWFFDDTPDHTDRNYVDDVFEFARSRGIEDKLIATLEYVRWWGYENPRNGTLQAVIWKDFAPWSFRFMIKEVDWQDAVNDYTLGTDIMKGSRPTILNGGIIYSGPEQPLDGGPPALTVSLEDDLEEGWSVHT